MKKFLIHITFLILSIAITSGPALAQTSEFTYQGRITQAGIPMNATRGIQFYLFDENGVQIPGAILERSVTIVNGVFSTTIDFGAAAFASGGNRSLQIAVANTEDAGDGYTFLSPRQPINSAPYALKSKSSDTAAAATSAATATNAAQLGGVSASQYLTTTSTAANAAQLGGISASQYLTTTSTAANAAQLGGVDASQYVTTSNGGSSFIRNGSTQQSGNFSITGSGHIGNRIGIGTTNPVTSLDVRGSMVLDNGGLYTAASGGEQNRYLALINSPTTQTASGLKAGGVLVSDDYFYANPGKNNLIVKGRVAIGTTNTFAQLYVVNSDAGSTGVFGKGNFGVSGESDFTSSGVGVYGSNNLSNTVGHAGAFNGRVHVSGTLSKSGGSFKIDHPLDPANKYLSHSFVESPDMMNIYNGNAITDERGEAVIVMPKYFDALNRDFRYQLTVIGQFAQVIVAEKIKNSSFKIRTDKPNVEVSWMVTGIRQDAYANENRILVEEDKPADERGLYLYPKGFNQSSEKNVMKPRHLPRTKEQK